MSVHDPKPRRSDALQPTILIADDTATVRAMGRDVLAEAGFEVIEAADGGEAIERFAECLPDLVLLDVEMPVADGFSVCHEIRVRSGGTLPPVVMMTARDDLDAIQRAYQVGATDFFPKPINWVIATHRIRYMLRASDAFSALQRSEEQLSWAQRVAAIGSWSSAIGSDASDCSHEFRRIFQLPSGAPAKPLEVILDRTHPEDRELVCASIDRTLLEGKPLRIDHRVVLPDGSLRYVHLQAQAQAGEGNRPQRLSGIAQDITERKRAEEEIRFLAFHDSLTRLANRRLFKEFLKQALARSRRSGGSVAILFLDLDHFKRINDTLGHSLGDVMLQRVADRVARCVRESDCVSRLEPIPGDTANVSRFGGDEFIVLLEDSEDENGCETVAKRILEVLAAPMVLGDQEIVISASIGIAMSPRDGEDADTLLRKADAAMYHAKAVGRNNYQLFRERLPAADKTHLALESELRKALKEGALEVYYQPKIDLNTGQPTGAEALARWNHPELGMVPPSDFVPVAEQTGMIGALGEFVLRSACLQAKRWHDEGLGPIRVSVNLSPQQFRNTGIVESVTQILKETGVSPGLMELEITESTLMENEENAIEALLAMRGIGLTVSLDDFGTGYSSLSYLKRFPIDTVKIDRSFVRDIPSDKDDAAIIAAIISMGQALGLRTLAEGVETEEQRAFLCERGCDEMQGYLMSPPVPPDALTELLTKDD